VVEGVVYIALGETYEAEAEASATSFREHHDLPVTRLPAPVGDEHGLSDPKHAAYHQKIRLLAESPYERTLFLDTDTLVCGPVWEIFAALEDSDIAVALAPTRRHTDRRPRWFQPEYNTGVIAYRTEWMRSFSREWERLFLSRVRTDITFGDQSVFAEALARSRAAVCPLAVEFNCRVAVPLQLVGPVKILHGRTPENLRRVAGYINDTLVMRVNLPHTGLLWWESGSFWFKPAYDSWGPVAVSRADLLHKLAPAAPEPPPVAPGAA
jgi:hypothetical protein